MNPEHICRTVADLFDATGRLNTPERRAGFIVELGLRIKGFGWEFGVLAEIDTLLIVQEIQEFGATGWRAAREVLDLPPGEGGLFPPGTPNVPELGELLTALGVERDTKERALGRLTAWLRRDLGDLEGWRSCYLYSARDMRPAGEPGTPVDGLRAILDGGPGGGPMVACEFLERLRCLTSGRRQESFADLSRSIADDLGVGQRLPAIRARVDAEPVDTRPFISIVVDHDRQTLVPVRSRRPANGTDPGAGYDDGAGLHYMNSDSDDEPVPADSQLPAAVAQLLGRLLSDFDEPDPIVEVVVGKTTELMLRFDSASYRPGKPVGTVVPLVVRPPARTDTDAIQDGRCKRWARLATVWARGSSFPEIRCANFREHAQRYVTPGDEPVGLAFSDGQPADDVVDQVVGMGIPVVLWPHNGGAVYTLLGERPVSELPQLLFRHRKDSKVGEFVLVWDDPYWQMTPYILGRTA